MSQETSNERVKPIVPMSADVQLLNATSRYSNTGGHPRYVYGVARPVAIAAPAVTTLKVEPGGVPDWIARSRRASSSLFSGVPCPSESNSFSVMPSASIAGSKVGELASASTSPSSASITTAAPAGAAYDTRAAARPSSRARSASFWISMSSDR